MDWLKSLKTEKGIKISKIVFLDYITQEKVSEKLYPNRKKLGKGKKKKVTVIRGGKRREIEERKATWVEPIVNRYFKLWRNADILEQPTSPKAIYFDKLERPHPKYWDRISLNVLFKYCKEIEKIDFTLDEKIYFAKLFYNRSIRKKITEEYPNEDVIQAILKFYIKNFILRYSFYLTEQENNPYAHREDKNKVKRLENEEILNKGRKAIHTYLKENYGLKKKFSSIKPLKVYAQGLPRDSLGVAFTEYYSEFENNPKMILGFDRKILKAIGILPLEKQNE